MPVDQPGLVHLTSNSGTELTLPSTVTVDGFTQSWTSHVARLAQGGEVAVAGPYPQSFDLFVRGMLIDPSAAEARERMDELKLVLLDAPVEVRILGSADDRYLLASPADLGRLNQDPMGRIGALNLRLRVHDPYWVADQVVETITGITTSPRETTITVSDGNVRPNPVVTFTFTTGANTTNPRIVNESAGFIEFLVPGTFTAGDVLTVDTQRMKVYDAEGTTYLDQMGNDFLLGGWPLVVGANDLAIYASGTIRMDVAIAYRPRWV